MTFYLKFDEMKFFLLIKHKTFLSEKKPQNDNSLNI